MLSDLAIPRIAEPDEITRLVLFVASDEASFSTEAVVEGGRAGHGRTSDGRLAVELSVPKQMGGEGGPGTDRLPATMREILSKSLTVRGFINNEFVAEHYPTFLREVGAGIADGRIRYREDFVAGLERAPAAFVGMLEGRNFGKLIVRVDG